MYVWEPTKKKSVCASTEIIIIFVILDKLSAYIYKFLFIVV